MNFNVCLLGGGSWGTTVASLVSRNASVALWARDKVTVAEINQKHTNSKYLPGATLHSGLTATDDLQKAVTGTDMIIMGIPSQGFRAVLKSVKPYVRPWIPIIASPTVWSWLPVRMTEIIQELLPHPLCQNMCQDSCSKTLSCRDTYMAL